ncbi:MAG TPA: hypothetical protein VMV31_13800 [Terriglobales bacterium]|nr:hypothetical protein [Terriglobales bacterium]
MGAPFHWVFHTPLAEQSDDFLLLAGTLARDFQAELSAAPAPAGRSADLGPRGPQIGASTSGTRAAGALGPAPTIGWVLRADFAGDEMEAEERGRAFWLELHSRCLDANLAMELVEGFEPAQGWRPASGLAPAPEASAAALPAAAAALAPPAPAALARQRPPIPAQTVYDLLRADDPDLDRNLDETIAWIEAAGLPVINLLSYLDLPLFRGYAAEHPDERDQNLFLHMLHTWACFRRWGAVGAVLPPALAQAFADPRYLRLNTTQFRSPAPALCLQLADWSEPVRPVAGGAPQWAKEIYLTHLDPPTPADDRELTLMIVSYDERGEFGFIPLEIPLSLPGVGESIAAFFAPSAGDEELGANTEDLHRLTVLAATYCLYATARDPALYLAG